MPSTQFKIGEEVSTLQITGKLLKIDEQFTHVKVEDKDWPKTYIVPTSLLLIKKTKNEESIKEELKHE